MTLIGIIEQVYNIINDAAHPRLQDYFFVRSIKPMLITIALYLLFVYGIGPAFMKNRPPYKLKGVLMIYNSFQIFANAYLFCSGVWLMSHANFVCDPIDNEMELINVTIANSLILYLYLKVLDLLDTVFFVLRKKNNQITFLHVYHHGIMIAMTWFGANYVPGGSSALVGLFNLPVHIVMYTYYLLTSLDVNMDKWKKNVTQMQLIQHVSLFILFTANLFHSCAYPKWMAGLGSLNAAVFIYLFSKFYYNTYIREPTKRKLKTT